MEKKTLAPVKTVRRDYALEIGQAHWFRLEFHKNGTLVNVTILNKYDHIAKCWGLEIQLEQQRKLAGFVSRTHFVPFDDEFLARLSAKDFYTEYADEEPLFAIASVNKTNGVAIVYTTDDAVVKGCH